jgi:FkbM family methyltransferase
VNIVLDPLEQLAAQNPKLFFLWSLKNAGIVDFTYLPPDGSPLWDGGQPLRMLVDQVMAPVAFANDAWQPEELQFIRDHVRDDRKYLLVDVGANVGFVTRQVLAGIPAVEGAICYEPEPANFDCLRFNVSHRQTLLTNAGLGDANSALKLYLDPTNCGNYSLNADAMTKGADLITVQILDARAESLKWLERAASEGERRFIYKSDTQGSDEWIASRIAPSFWERVDVAVLELWRIDKRRFDSAAFAAVLDTFPNKVALASPETRLATRDLLEYLAGHGREEHHVDLGMWK